jgi:hypothetical protein
MSMGKRNGLSRGDARRNARLIRIRGIVRGDRAILAIDLADTKQVLALCDHDSRVLARRSVRGRAWHLGEAIGWARATAIEHGFAGIVVGCEPTGHRWRIVAELCDRLGIDLVCVQPLLVGRAREQEDLTRDKSDPKDAVLIGRLVGQLRCYLPERTDQVWARLRQLGARRQALTATANASRQQLRDLLECAWPAVLEAAAEPLDSATWRAAVQVALDRTGATGELATLARVGYARFARQVTSALARWGAKRRCLRIVRAVWTAATSPQALQLGVSTSSTSPAWSPPSLGSARSAPPPSWPRPATRPVSIRPARWSSTPACAPAPTSPAPTPAPPASPDEVDPPCGWRPGGRPGARSRTTRSWPPATPTSPPAPTTSSPRPRPAPRWPRPCCGGCGWWSPSASAGRPPSPPAPSTPAGR